MGDKERTVAALILTGAPGSGKTTTLLELGTRLEIAGQPYGAIESEQLAMGSPLLSSERWIPQLAAVLALQREAGRRFFLVAATVESAADLRSVVAATGADRVLVVCLRAGADVLAARIDAREPDTWPGKEALIEHTRELASVAPAIEGVDLVVDTEQCGDGEVVAQVLDALVEAGMLTVRAGG
jgi:hypothetical protein